MALIVISSIALLLTMGYAGAVFYFRSGWQKLPLYAPEAKAPLTSVSILIAARNEEECIAFTIEDILKQNYPQGLVELIVVDDHSTDRTANIVEWYGKDGVKLIKLREDQTLNSYKKKAITVAINEAKGDLIITTDADCRMGPEWLRSIASFYEKNNYKMVSSPVSYFKEKSQFERLQTLEFLYLIGLGASSIGNGKPSTCNGANLAYRRDVFFELGGFKGIDNLASGDDELFLHKVAAKYPQGVGFCKSRHAIVYTTAKPNLKEFIRQRKRWASKSTKYKEKSIVFLGVAIWVFNVSVFLHFLLGFINQTYWLVLSLIILLKFIAEYVFLKDITEFTRRKELLKLLPLLTIIHVLYIIYIGVAGNSGKYVWKDRLVR
ncbi:glycosyltransferase family 2 protein [Desertivirga arenae]|uniref:glycosyltransferase family 2 protein n=1 Tax=Desertivirga arenae TaxID=2810309 RepID=UPI001F606FC5|nr:glycosyltransferase [Pedobacter sp. SYSU D00823]